MWVMGNVALQAVLVYEIIFAAVALYACFYGVGASASYLLLGGNVFAGCSPIALFNTAHNIYLSVLSAVTEAGVLAGSIAAFVLLCNKVYGRLFAKVLTQAQSDAVKIIDQASVAAAAPDKGS